MARRKVGERMTVGLGRLCFFFHPHFTLFRRIYRAVLKTENTCFTRLEARGRERKALPPLRMKNPENAGRDFNGWRCALRWIRLERDVMIRSLWLCRLDDEHMLQSWLVWYVIHFTRHLIRNGFRFVCKALQGGKILYELFVSILINSKRFSAKN